MEIKRVVELRKARGEGSISRRGFLRLTAGTTALAGLAACTQVTAPSAVGMPADAPAAAPETGDARSDLLERFDRAGW